MAPYVSDEIEDRAALFLEADTIIGKPSANVENDDVLDGNSRAN